MELSRLAVQLAVANFVPKNFMDSTSDFKKARLVKSDSEGWYVLFYVWNVQKNKLERKRKFIPAQYKSDSSKTSFAKDFIKKVNLLLSEGYHIDASKTRENQTSQKIKDKELSIKEAIALYKEVCLSIDKNTEKEARAKERVVERFFEWLIDNQYYIHLLRDIDENIATEYSDFLLTKRKLKAKSYNNTIGRLKNFFNESIRRKWFEGSNPFKSVSKQKASYGEMNMPYTGKQINDIKEFLLENDPYLWNFICFIYYAFMRSTEIMRLQVKNIDLEKGLLHIRADQSKVGKYDILPIAPALMDVIRTMNLEHCSPEHYLFTTKNEPSENKLYNNWASDRYKKVKNRLGLSANYSIYGFKHTAVCRWYDKDKDIVRIQKMCRHTTIEMTARYLKSIGLLTDVYKV